MKLENNTILITGGASGYGLELANQLSAENKVIICGRTVEKLELAKRKNPELVIFRCDVSLKEDRTRLYKFILENYAGLNMLVNNAAIVHKFDFMEHGDALRFVEEEIDTNFIAPVALTKSLMPIMSKNSLAAIINISTGLVHAPKAKYPGYCPSKMALHGFTNILRHQTKGDMKVIEVFLPVVATDFHKGEVPKGAITAHKAAMLTLDKLQGSSENIYVGKAGLLQRISRISPSFAMRKVNSL